MTKKFITGETKQGKTEFVIPDIIDKRNLFIGIESRNEYKTGLICYTGVELSVEKVMDGLPEEWHLTILQKRRARKIIDSYLTQIKTFKISKSVKVGANFALELADKK